MKGIRYLTDSRNRRKAVIIPLDAIQKNAEKVHEFLDVLVAETRKNDKMISWHAAKKYLKKKGI